MTPVLHSVSYAGAWPGHSLLDVDAFLAKAVELGFGSVALVAKRPHVSPLDYDAAARKRLRDRLRSAASNWPRSWATRISPRGYSIPVFLRRK